MPNQTNVLQLKKLNACARRAHKNIHINVCLFIFENEVWKMMVYFRRMPRWRWVQHVNIKSLFRVIAKKLIWA